MQTASFSFIQCPLILSRMTETIRTNRSVLQENIYGGFAFNLSYIFQE